MSWIFISKPFNAVIPVLLLSTYHSSSATLFHELFKKVTQRLCHNLVCVWVCVCVCVCVCRRHSSMSVSNKGPEQTQIRSLVLPCHPATWWNDQTIKRCTGGIYKPESDKSRLIFCELRPSWNFYMRLSNSYGFFPGRFRDAKHTIHRKRSGTLRCDISSMRTSTSMKDPTCTWCTDKPTTQVSFSIWPRYSSYILYCYRSTTWSLFTSHKTYKSYLINNI